MSLLETIIGRGTTAAKPAAAAANEGYLYFDTDLDKLQRSNGTSWEDVERTDPAGGATPTFVGVYAIKSASFPSLANSTLTTLAFEAADIYDTDGFHDPASNNTRLTVPAGKAGYYQPWSTIGFASNATGRRGAQLALNGSATGSVIAHQAVNGASTTILFTFPPMLLAEGDFLEVQALQSSGGSLSTNDQRFGMYLLGT